LFAVVLCVLALFVAQMSGRGNFVCVCGGKPLVTPTSYCYGPHGDQCHTGDVKVIGSPGDEESGSREEHQVVKQDLSSRSWKTAPQLIAPMVLLAMLPGADWSFASRDAKDFACYSEAFGESPPSGVTVARTIVLLI